MNLKNSIRTIPNFPKPGILFRDITTLINNDDAFSFAIDKLSDSYRMKGIKKVAGIEARGFIFGAAIAKQLGVGFLPIRKKGKLPGSTYKQDYKLEYGTDTLEIHKNCIAKQEKILLIDDLIATGGSAEAAIKLLHKAGGNVVGAAFVIDLPDLGGLAKIMEMGVPVTTLVTFSGC